VNQFSVSLVLLRDANVAKRRRSGRKEKLQPKLQMELILRTLGTLNFQVLHYFLFLFLIYPLPGLFFLLAGAKQDQEDKTVLTSVLESVQANEAPGKGHQETQRHSMEKQLQQEHEDGEADITLQQRMGLIASFHLLMLQGFEAKRLMEDGSTEMWVLYTDLGYCMLYVGRHKGDPQVALSQPHVFALFPTKHSGGSTCSKRDDKYQGIQIHKCITLSLLLLHLPTSFSHLLDHKLAKSL
jgi:hypothetical protein